MSGVYIPGIRDLKCDECFWCIGYRIKCHAQNIDVVHGNKRADCPLIPVPDHGRLIDADELVKFAPFWFIREAPTIIPASKEGGE